MLLKRNAGVLLHITSLPNKSGVGTLGKEAYDFIDWLKKSNMSVWQVLPLVPTNYGDSPYQSVSSTALNYYLIDFDILNEKGLLNKEEYENVCFSTGDNKVNYEVLFNTKVKILRTAFSRFNVNSEEFKAFIKKGNYADFALFMTIKEMNEYKAWEFWAPEYQEYSKELANNIKTKHKDDYLFWQWTQYEFELEWNKLHKYAKKNGIQIMGDMPLYVAYDSVEVWKTPELFDLTEDKKPRLVAGCPPDAFSADGQLWGNPIYDWEYMKANKYKWWTMRINRAFELVDILRIDHFRGFDRYYTIPYGDETARNGKWEHGPKFNLFKDKTTLNIVAEDLGFIDEGVYTLLRNTQYPGMKILEFAFDGDSKNEHKPSNYSFNYVVYTGTHDNMPMYQYLTDLTEEDHETLVNDVEKECQLLKVTLNKETDKELFETLVDLAFASKANMCIIPMQDLLVQDGTTRMNLPSTVSTNNWSYRVKEEELSEELSKKLASLAKAYKR